MDKIIKSFLFSFILFLFSFSYVRAKTLPQVIFINQVRGVECCDQGSLENFSNQLEKFSDSDIPAFFALRYDAMTDKNFVKVINQYKRNDLITFGVMLEVTPQLAKDAFVEYKDSPENWFQAQNAFLIGYQPENRVRLVDKIVSAYNEIFKENPQFSTAWQVDNLSLQYLKQEYDLKMHQIAREQWGLDSYTLDGGPPHYPYLASNKWFFNPDFSNYDNLLIVRHTIDDSLYTYGDNSSAFTSQPNDYVLDNKDFGYFERLLDQVLNQTHQIGFANLGLENSMVEEHQVEYQKQIDKIIKFKNESKVEVVSDIDQLKVIYQSERITIHEGTDLISGKKEKVFFITTPKYRLRIRFSADKVFISDLRLYHPQLEDPYKENPAQNKGYLINPYLINDGISFPSVKQPSRVQKFLNIPMINSFTAEPKNDLSNVNDSIQLPESTSFDDIKMPSKNTISYQSKLGLITFSFNQDNFTVSGINNKNLDFILKEVTANPVLLTQNNNGGELKWQIEDETSHKMSWECKDQACLFNFELNPLQFSKIRQENYPFIFPEKKTREIDPDKTITYVHNRYAIAGRNPVRIVLVPQDKNGFPTSSENSVQVDTDSEIDVIRVEEQNASREYQFVDLSNDSPKEVTVNLNLDKLELEPQTVYFAPNCKTNVGYCLKHPKQTWWFIRTIIEDKIRLKLLGEKQE